MAGDCSEYIVGGGGGDLTSQILDAEARLTKLKLKLDEDVKRLTYASVKTVQTLKSGNSNTDELKKKVAENNSLALDKRKKLDKKKQERFREEKELEAKHKVLLGKQAAAVDALKEWEVVAKKWQNRLRRAKAEAEATDNVLEILGLSYLRLNSDDKGSVVSGFSLSGIDANIPEGSCEIQLADFNIRTLTFSKVVSFEPEFTGCRNLAEEINRTKSVCSLILRARNHWADDFKSLSESETPVASIAELSTSIDIFDDGDIG